MPSKKVNQRKHSRLRANERFGMPFGRREEQQLIEQIRNGAPVAWKTSLRVRVFVCRLWDKKVLAAYDKQRKTICTLMPIEFAADHAAELLCASEELA